MTSVTMPKKNKHDLEEEFKEEIVDVDSRLIDSPDYLLQNYVMLHGTNCVWDISTGAMLKVEHLRSICLPASRCVRLMAKAGNRGICT